MANTIKIKAGSGTPTTSNIADRELAFDRSANKLYINDAGSIVELNPDANAGDITSVVAGTGLSGGATSGVATLNVDAAQTQITSIGTIGTGVWNGTAIASAYLDADTAHLSTTQTFTGAKTFSDSLRITGSTKHLYIDNDAENESGLWFRDNQDPNNQYGKIFFDSNGSANALNFYVQSGTPVLKLQTSAMTVSGTGGTDGAAGSPTLRLSNTVDSTDWDTGDVVGTLEYYAQDPSGNAPYVTSFIKSVNGVDGSNGTLPSGSLSFGVSAYNAVGGAVEKMQLTSVGDLVLSGGSLTLPVAEKLYFGGGSHTYIGEDVDDRLRFFVGGDEFMRFTQQDAAGEIINLYQDIYIPDGKKIHLGAGNDLKLQHDGSNSYIQASGTGNLYIQQNTADLDLILQCDDGSGGTTAYLTIDGSAHLVNFDKATRHYDGSNAYFGTNLDGKIIHDGSNFYVANVETGDLYIQNELNDRDVILRSDDGSGGVTAYLTLDGSITTTTFNQNARVVDSKKIGFGNADDLQIQHDGTNSYIDNDTGMLFIRNTLSDQDIRFTVNDGGVTSNLMTLNSASSRVGIGTTAPAQKLHVAGNVMISNNQFFIGEDADGDDINLLGIHSNNNCYVGPSSNAWAGGAILYGAASTTNAHVWYEGNAERMRIADNGFLGIGTTSPGYKLDVAGDYRFKDTASGGALLGYHHNDSDNGLLLVAYGSTYSGGSTLSVGANGTAYDHTHNVGIDAGASSFIALGVGGSEKMRVHTDGSVGIGTTSPAHILDVVGTAGLSTGTAWTNTSDKRIKTNVENIENGLDKILKLRPVSFNYTEDYLKANPELSGSQRYNSFIAQEYEEVFPDAVTSEKELVVDGKVIYDDLKQFTPHDLNMYLVKAIQEMKCEIDELKLKIGE